MAGAGYTPDQITAFKLADIDAIYEAWALAPPVHELAANYLGYKPKRRPKRGAPQVAAPKGMSVASLRAQYPDKIMRG